jgi:hypothetical protein
MGKLGKCVNGVRGYWDNGLESPIPFKIMNSQFPFPLSLLINYDLYSSSWTYSKIVEEAF